MGAGAISVNVMGVGGVNLIKQSFKLFKMRKSTS